MAVSPERLPYLIPRPGRLLRHDVIVLSKCAGVGVVQKAGPGELVNALLRGREVPQMPDGVRVDLHPRHLSGPAQPDHDLIER